jgi:SEC-C motif-containing protein
MRSRYTAYVVCDVDHLEASLSPSRRYDFDEESVRQWSQEAVWKGLEILSTREGGPEDDRGEVEFVARFEDQGEEHEFRERALFRRENGAWFYHDGKVKAGETYRREAPKVGRNEPCPCGSGKKFKKCCA